MSSGSLARKILIYSVPLMLSGMLQLLYNTADVIVVGRYVGDTALAAVGSTGSLTNLITNLFIGLSVGASVAVAQYFGAKDKKNTSEVVHTAITISFILGVISTVIGVCFARVLLKAMDTPDDVIDSSVLYMRIYFSGMTASMVFNFGSSILRAVGDTKRPLIYLVISGTVNVVLNLVLVICFGLGVAGVAIATVVSQVISAVLVVLTLIKTEGACQLHLRELGIHKDKMIRMLRIGIPAGLQGSIFALSNVLIQSSINSFGKSVMAGNTAASNIDGFIYIACNAFYHSALAFTGQNYGAKKYDRLGRVLKLCMIFVTVTGLVMGLFAFVFAEPLLRIYAPESEDAVSYGLIRLGILGLTYFTCGIMDVVVGALRGLGASLLPMIVSVVGVCGIRIGWIYTAFAMSKTLEMLYISYPVSWISVAVIQYICYRYLKKRLLKNNVDARIAEAVPAVSV